MAGDKIVVNNPKSNNFMNDVTKGIAETTKTLNIIASNIKSNLTTSKTDTKTSSTSSNGNVKQINTIKTDIVTNSKTNVSVNTEGVKESVIDLQKVADSIKNIETNSETKISVNTEGVKEATKELEKLSDVTKKAVSETEQLIKVQEKLKSLKLDKGASQKTVIEALSGLNNNISLASKAGVGLNNLKNLRKTLSGIKSEDKTENDIYEFLTKSFTNVRMKPIVNGVKNDSFVKGFKEIEGSNVKKTRAVIQYVIAAEEALNELTKDVKVKAENVVNNVEKAKKTFINTTKKAETTTAKTIHISAFDKDSAKLEELAKHVEECKKETDEALLHMLKTLKADNPAYQAASKVLVERGKTFQKFDVSSLERNGRNITVDDFKKAFGITDVLIEDIYKDVKDRQKALNKAYDDFLKFSKTTGITPTSIGNNSLVYGITNAIHNNVDNKGHSTYNKISVTNAGVSDVNTNFHELGHQLLNKIAEKFYADKLNEKDSSKRITIEEAVDKLFDSKSLRELIKENKLSNKDEEIIRKIINIVETAKKGGKNGGWLNQSVNNNLQLLGYSGAELKQKSDYYTRNDEVFARLVSRFVGGYDKKSDENLFEVDDEKFNRLLYPLLKGLFKETSSVFNNITDINTKPSTTATPSKSKTNAVVEKVKNDVKRSEQEKKVNKGMTIYKIDSSSKEASDEHIKSTIAEATSFAKNFEEVINSAVKTFEKKFKSAITNMADTFKNEFIKPFKQAIDSIGGIVTSLQKAGIVDNKQIQSGDVGKKLKDDIRSDIKDTSKEAYNKETPKQLYGGNRVFANPIVFPRVQYDENNPNNSYMTINGDFNKPDENGSLVALKNPNVREMLTMIDSATAKYNYVKLADALKKHNRVAIDTEMFRYVEEGTTQSSYEKELGGLLKQLNNIRDTYTKLGKSGRAGEVENLITEFGNRFIKNDKINLSPVYSETVNAKGEIIGSSVSGWTADTLKPEIEKLKNNISSFNTEIDNITNQIKSDKDKSDKKMTAFDRSEKFKRLGMDFNSYLEDKSKFYDEDMKNKTIASTLGLNYNAIQTQLTKLQNETFVDDNSYKTQLARIQDEITHFKNNVKQAIVDGAIATSTSKSIDSKAKKDLNDKLKHDKEFNKNLDNIGKLSQKQIAEESLNSYFDIKAEQKQEQDLLKGSNLKSDAINEMREIIGDFTVLMNKNVQMQDESIRTRSSFVTDQRYLQTLSDSNLRARYIDTVDKLDENMGSESLRNNIQTLLSQLKSELTSANKLIDENIKTENQRINIEQKNNELENKSLANLYTWERNQFKKENVSDGQKLIEGVKSEQNLFEYQKKDDKLVVNSIANQIKWEQDEYKKNLDIENKSLANQIEWERSEYKKQTDLVYNSVKNQQKWEQDEYKKNLDIENKSLANQIEWEREAERRRGNPDDVNMHVDSFIDSLSSQMNLSGHIPYTRGDMFNRIDTTGDMLANIILAQQEILNNITSGAYMNDQNGFTNALSNLTALITNANTQINQNSNRENTLQTEIRKMGTNISDFERWMETEVNINGELFKRGDVYYKQQNGQFTTARAHLGDLQNTLSMLQSIDVTQMTDDSLREQINIIKDIFNDIVKDIHSGIDTIITETKLSYQRQEENERDAANDIINQSKIDSALHREELDMQKEFQTIDTEMRKITEWYFGNISVGNQNYQRSGIIGGTGYTNLTQDYLTLYNRIASGEFQNDPQAFSIAINEFKETVRQFRDGSETLVKDFQNAIRQMAQQARTLMTNGNRMANRQDTNMLRIQRNSSLNNLFSDYNDYFMRGNVRIRLTEDESHRLEQYRRMTTGARRQLVRRNGETDERYIQRATRINEMLNRNEQRYNDLREEIANRTGRRTGILFNEYQEHYAPLMQQFMQNTGFNIFRMPNERSVNWELLAGGMNRDNSGRYEIEIAKFINFPSLKQGLQSLFKDIWGVVSGIGKMLGSAFNKLYSLGKSALTTLTIAIGGVTASITGAIAAFTAFGKSVISTTDEFRRNTLALTGVYRTPARAHEMIQMAYRTSANMPMDYSAAMTTLNEISAIPAVQRVLRSPDRAVSQSMMDKMFKVITAMTTMRPDKTASDAVFSLRNAFAGDLRSLQRRFDLPTSAMPNVRGGIGLGAVKNDPMEMLDSLNEYFDSFLDMDVLNQVSRTVGVIVDKIKGAFNLFKANIGASGFYDLVLKDVDKIKNVFVDFVDSDYGREIARRLSDALGNTYESIREIVFKIGRSVLNAFGFGGNFDIGDILTKTAEGFAKTLRYLEHIIEKFDIEGTIKKVIDYISDIDIENVLNIIIDGVRRVVDGLRDIASEIVNVAGSLNNMRNSLGISNSQLGTGIFFMWLFGTGNVVNAIGSTMHMIQSIIMTGLGALGTYVSLQSTAFMLEGTGAAAAIGKAFTKLGGIIKSVALGLTKLLLPLYEIYFFANNYERIGETTANIFGTLKTKFMNFPNYIELLFTQDNDKRKEIKDKIANSFYEEWNKNKKIYNPENKNIKWLEPNSDFMQWATGTGKYANNPDGKDENTQNNTNYIGYIKGIYESFKNKIEPFVKIAENAYKHYFPNGVDTNYVKLVNGQTEALNKAVNTQKQQYVKGFGFETALSVFGTEDDNADTIYFGPKRIEKLKSELRDSIGNTEEYINTFNTLVSQGVHVERAREMAEKISENGEAVTRYINEINNVINKSIEMIEDSVASAEFKYLSKDVGKYISAQTRVFGKKLNEEVYMSIIQEYSSYFATNIDNRVGETIKKELANRNGDIYRLIGDYRNNRFNYGEASSSEIKIIDDYMKRLGGVAIQMRPVVDELNRRSVIQGNISNMRLGDLNANWETLMRDSSRSVRNAAGERYKALIDEGIETEPIEKMATKVVEITANGFNDMKTILASGVKDLMTGTHSIMKNGLVKFATEGGTVKPMFKEMWDNAKKTVAGVYSEDVSNRFTERLFQLMTGSTMEKPLTPEEQFMSTISTDLSGITRESSDIKVDVNEFKMNTSEKLETLVNSVKNIEAAVPALQPTIDKQKEEFFNGGKLGEVAIKKQQEWQTDKTRYNELIKNGQTDTDEFKNLRKKWNLEVREYTKTTGQCARLVSRSLDSYGLKVAHGNANDYRENLIKYAEKNPTKLRRIDVSNPDDLMKYYNSNKNYIMSYAPGTGHKYGHIEISLGNGKGISDFIKQDPSKYIDMLKNGNYNDLIVFEPLIQSEISKQIKNINTKYDSSIAKKNFEKNGSLKIQNIDKPEYRYDNDINRASALIGISPAVLKGLIKQESSFNPNDISKTGAVGIMQMFEGAMNEGRAAINKLSYERLIPDYVDYRKDPEKAILGGAGYLKKMVDRFGGRLDLGLSAYNWGPGTMDKFLVKSGYGNYKNDISNVPDIATLLNKFDYVLEDVITKRDKETGEIKYKIDKNTGDFKLDKLGNKIVDKLGIDKTYALKILKHASNYEKDLVFGNTYSGSVNLKQTEGAGFQPMEWHDYVQEQELKLLDNELVKFDTIIDDKVKSLLETYIERQVIKSIIENPDTYKDTDYSTTAYDDFVSYIEPLKNYTNTYDWREEIENIMYDTAEKIANQTPEEIYAEKFLKNSLDSFMNSYYMNPHKEKSPYDMDLNEHLTKRQADELWENVERDFLESESIDKIYRNAENDFLRQEEEIKETKEIIKDIRDYLTELVHPSSITRTGEIETKVINTLSDYGYKGVVDTIKTANVANRKIRENAKENYEDLFAPKEPVISDEADYKEADARAMFKPLEPVISKPVRDKGGLHFTFKTTGKYINRAAGGFMANGSNIGHWFNNMLFGTGDYNKETGEWSGDTTGILGGIGSIMEDSGGKAGGLGGILKIAGGLVSGKGIPTAIAKYLGSAADLTSPAGIIGTGLGAVTKFFAGGKAGGAVASSVKGFLTSGVGSAILPVAALAYGIKKLTKTKDKTAEGRARYADFQNLKQGLVDRSSELDSTYALASDLTRGLLTSYDFGYIGINKEHKGGTTRHLKGTARDVAHTDATGFVNSLQGYWNLLLKASQEQAQGQVALDTLQSTNNMAYLNKSNYLISKQVVATQNEMKKYQDAVKSYAGRDANYKQTLFDGKEYTLAELENKVEEFIKTLGDLTQESEKKAEEMRKEQLNTEYARLDYELARDHGADPLMQYNNELKKLELEWKSVNNGRGYEEGTREWYEYMTRWENATQNLENATEEMEKSAKELAKSIGSNWVQILSGIRNQDGNYMYTQVQTLASWYSTKANAETALNKGEDAWGAKLTDEDRKNVERNLENANEMIDHLTARYNFTNTITGYKQNITDRMYSITSGIDGSTYGYDNVTEHIADYASSLASVNRYSEDFLKTGQFSGYDDFMTQIVSPIMDNINNELNSMMDVYTQLYSSGYYSKTTGKSTFMAPMMNYLTQLDNLQTAYMKALDSGDQKTIDKALKNLESFLDTNNTYFKKLGQSYQQAKDLLAQASSRQTILSSISGFDDYEIANKALTAVRSALGNIDIGAFNELLGVNTGVTTMTGSNIKTWFGVKGEDPYETYYELQKKNILQQLQNSEHKSDEWNQALIDLWNLMLDNAKYLEDKMERMPDTIDRVLGSMSGYEDYEIANSALTEFNKALGKNALNNLVGGAKGLTTFTDSNIAKWFGVSGEDPYETYYEYQKKTILDRIKKEQEGSEDWYNAELDLWNLMMENAKYLKDKAEKTSQTIEDMLDKINETVKTRVAEEAKTSKGDIIFFDLGSTRGGGANLARQMLNAVKTQDPDAQKLIQEYMKKMGLK